MFYRWFISGIWNGRLAACAEYFVNFFDYLYDLSISDRCFKPINKMTYFKKGER